MNTLDRYIPRQQSLAHAGYDCAVMAHNKSVVILAVAYLMTVRLSVA